MSISNKHGVASCLFAVALLQGCMSVGPDFKTPDLAVPAAYGPASEPMPAEARLAAGLPAGPWWKAFGSDELDATIAKAFTNSPTIAEADAVLDSVAAQLRVARAGDLPQVDVNANRGRELINLSSLGIDPAAFGLSGLPPLQRYSVGASVSYDLDLFGGQKRAKELARANLESEADRAAAARLTLAGNIVLQAMEIASLQSQIKAAEDIVVSDKETLSLAERAISLGSVAPATRLAPDAQLAADEAALPPLQSRLAAAKHNLALLLGEAPGATTQPEFTLADFTAPNDAPIVIPSELVRRRPDIRASEATLHAAIARIGIKTADLYPKLELSGSVTQLSTTLGELLTSKSTAWVLGAGITAPLFHGGELRAQVRGAKADARAAEARYRNTVLRAFVEVANALSSLHYDTEALQAQEKALKTAEANLKAKRRLYELGRDDLLDALDAQRTANVARRQMAAMEGARLQSLARLYATTAVVDATQSK